MSALLQVEGLRVDLPTPMGMLHAVRGVDLALDAGETLCLVGESGCGKSLSALALMGLLPRAARRSAVHFSVAGEDLQRASEARMADLRGNRMAMIFQEPMTALNPVIPIGVQISETLLLHQGLSGNAAGPAKMTVRGKNKTNVPAGYLPLNCRAPAARG